MNWIIIIALVILAFSFLRVKHMKHKIYLVVIILIILFVYITATRILASHENDWKTVSGVSNALKIYFNWLRGVAGNFKVIAANAIHLDWNLNDTETKSIEK